MRIFNTNVDAYNWIVSECMFGDSYRQDVQCGSFENEACWRMQLRPLMICIVDPTNFTYLPKEVTIGMIEKYYLEEITNNEVQERQTYTYGERLMSQLPVVLERLRLTPQTNQAVITTSQPSDVVLRDPPCLREIAFSCFDDELNITTFWRSNDTKEAFLMNQGAMALLLRDCAEYAGLRTGKHYYCSSGVHVYER